MRRKILLIDDCKINLMYLHKILSPEYDTLEAENGEDGLAILNRQKTSVSAVILDLVMPVMDGYEVLRRISEDPLLSQIPVFVSTGNMDAEAEKAARALGARDYFTKPYQTEIIRQSLSHLFAQNE